MNFERLFRDYKVEYNTRVNRGWTNITCPFCDDSTFNGGFNNSGDYFHCWKCGSHPFQEALWRVLAVPKSEIASIIKNYHGRNESLNVLNRKKNAVVSLELPTDTFTKAEKQYLKKRGFSPRHLKEKYGVVGGGIVGEWKYRIIVPLFYNGRLVSWVGRSILSKQQQEEYEIPRYKNLSIEKSVIDPKSTFFNLDNCNNKVGVLLEGPFDVMRMGDNFFCSFGTELTQNQIRIIGEKFNEVYILFDNEMQAQKKARKVGLQLSSIGINVEIIDCLGDYNVNDPGELNNVQAEKLRKDIF